jgi:hypothetical protein
MSDLRHKQNNFSKSIKIPWIVDLDYIMKSRSESFCAEPRD